MTAIVKLAPYAGNIIEKLHILNVTQLKSLRKPVGPNVQKCRCSQSKTDTKRLVLILLC